MNSDEFGLLGPYRQGGLHTQAELDAYEARVKYRDDLRRALYLAYSDGEATPEQIAALGVDPAIWAEAQRQDKETSNRKASANFTSNMLPLAIIAAAYGVDAMGIGGGSAGSAAGGSGGALGAGAGLNPELGFLNPGPVTMGADFLTPSVVGAGAGIPSTVPFLNPGPVTMGADILTPSMVGSSGLPSMLSNLGSAKSLATLGGALLNGLNSGDRTTTQTVGKEPWGPAQPWIKDNIATGQALQKWYQQNPFSAQQKAGIQNTLSDADNFRARVVPGLLDFANGMMGGQYQRQRGGAPGSGGGYGGAVVPGGYTAGSGQVFGVAPGQRFGTVDWEAMNPFAVPRAGAANGG